MVYTSRKFLVFVFSMVLVLSFFHPVFAQSAQAQMTDVKFPDAGVTPDNAFYGVKIWYQNNIRLTFASTATDKAKLESEFAAQRFAEAKAMIDAGKYTEAGVAMANAKTTLDEFEKNVNSIADDAKKMEYSSFRQSGTPADTLAALKADVFTRNQQIEVIHSEIIKNVDDKKVDEKTAAAIVNDVKEKGISVQDTFEKQKLDIAKTVADNSGVTQLEVNQALNAKEDTKGVTQFYKQKLSDEELASLRGAITQAEQDSAAAKKTGKEIPGDVVATLENAKLALRIVEQARDSKDYNRAYEKFVKTEQFVLDADKRIKDPNAVVSAGVDEFQKDIESESKQYVSDYAKAKDVLLQQYPDKKEGFEKMNEQEKKVVAVSDKLNDFSAKEFERFKTMGKSEDDARAEVAKEVAKEFEVAHGETPVPVGFFDDKKSQGNIAWNPSTGEVLSGEVKGVAGGGFVEGQKYAMNGYTYEFSNGAYTVTTPAGQKENVKFPEGYLPENRFSHGDEKYTYTSPDGTAVTYAATGVVVQNPDGTEQKTSYAKDSYKIVGGASVDVTPTGYAFASKDGAITSWEFNPATKTYTDTTTGKVFVPDASPHSDKTSYDAVKKEYVVQDPTGSGAIYEYQGSGSWKTPTGTYRATVVDAPVGYEDKKVYATASGETWAYKDGAWQSSAGSKYVPAPNNYARYENGKYVDAQGNTHEASGNAGGGYKDYSGKTWNYDSSMNTWKSDSGEAYNPSNGQTTGTGNSPVRDANSQQYQQYGAFYNKDGKVTDYGKYSGQQNFDSNVRTENGVTKQNDMNGNTWVQGADGSWSNQGGGTNNYGGEYGGQSGSSGNNGGWTQKSDGSWVGSNGESGGSSGGSWSGGSGGSGSGSWSGSSGSGYSGGSYSGGSSGGSYSGGSSGGSYSGGGGGSGYVIYQFPTTSGLTGKIIFSIQKYRLF